mmetsp:Transcript_76781/g.134084  ORF Transcript_76781/g.134084 Transcript_76781/m.134084 type:complete len:93 (+) Transcript_76781:2-280(+)
MIVSSSDSQWAPCYKYGTRFVSHLNLTDEEHLTDLCDADMDLESWVSEACPDAQVQQSSDGRIKSLKRSVGPKRLSSLLAIGNQHSLILPNS